MCLSERDNMNLSPQMPKALVQQYSISVFSRNQLNFYFVPLHYCCEILCLLSGIFPTLSHVKMPEDLAVDLGGS